MNVGALKCIYGGMQELHHKLEEFAKQWKGVAKDCEYCIGEGGDGLECRFPNDDEDPFCYPSRCPLLK